MKKFILQDLNLAESNRLSAEEKRKVMGGLGLPSCYGGAGTWCECVGQFIQYICIPPDTLCSQHACPAEP